MYDCWDDVWVFKYKKKMIVEFNYVLQIVKLLLMFYLNYWGIPNNILLF